MTSKQRLINAYEEYINSNNDNYESQNNVHLERLSEYLNTYLKENSTDFDRFSLIANYYILAGNYEKAWTFAKTALDINPHCLEAVYNAAYIAECYGKLEIAHRYYGCLINLQKTLKKTIIENSLLDTYITNIENIAKNRYEQGDKYLKIKLTENRQYIYNTFLDPYKNDYNIVGSIFGDEKENAYYVARYGNWYDNYFNSCPPANAIQTKIEMYAISSIAKNIEICMEGNYILPVVSITNHSIKNNNIAISNDSLDFNINMQNKESYNYLRLQNKVRLKADEDIVVAKSIPIRHINGNKKLVLSIFIDSFNWNIFSRFDENADALNGLRRLMPNTYKMFEKGNICTNAYVSSEWTTPSLSTYFTGVESDKHMNLVNEIWYPFSEKLNLLPEYFKRQGYFTATISANDACTPSKGYMRGFDRLLYRHNGYSKQEIVTDALEHIRTFSGCDQFLMLQFQDLHEIAGGFMRDLFVQANTQTQYFEIDNSVHSTVKQTRSFNREHILINELKDLDFYMGILFDYIVKNYSEEEYVISLFSDHGTAFMVDDNKPIICPDRMRVPFMFKASGFFGVINEYVQSADYGRILCKMCNIEYDQKLSEGNLPRAFGGGVSREYAFAQTIFTGDVYQAMIRMENATYYYMTQVPVDDEYRIDINNAREWIEDDDGNTLDDSMRCEWCRAIVLDRIKNLIVYN